ncbi:hypothetical protein Pan110_31460 [Gimesia panareensis]|nr:hypothetical protein Pan110_31460 [Gimesia panareensis]
MLSVCVCSLKYMLTFTQIRNDFGGVMMKYFVSSVLFLALFTVAFSFETALPGTELDASQISRIQGGTCGTFVQTAIVCNSYSFVGNCKDIDSNPLTVTCSGGCDFSCNPNAMGQANVLRSGITGLSGALDTPVSQCGTTQKKICGKLFFTCVCAGGVNQPCVYENTNVNPNGCGG